MDALVEAITCTPQALGQFLKPTNDDLTTLHVERCHQTATCPVPNYFFALDAIPLPTSTKQRNFGLPGESHAILHSCHASVWMLIALATPTMPLMVIKTPSTSVDLNFSTRHPSEGWDDGILVLFGYRANLRPLRNCSYQQ